MVQSICARQNSQTTHSLTPLEALEHRGHDSRSSTDLHSLTSWVFSAFLLCLILLRVSFLSVSPRFLSDPAAGPGPGQ